MNPASLLRLLASLCLMLIGTLTGCMKSHGHDSVPGGVGASPDSGGAERLATRGDAGYRGTAQPIGTAPAPADASGAYGGDGSYYAEEAAPSRDYDDAVATAPRTRPGLGTSYGEHHYSQITTAPFLRGSSSPDVLLSLWYNDAEGIRLAQGSYSYGYDTVSQSMTTDGTFVVSVVDEHGYAMSAATVGDKRYVLGEPGQRYKLQVQNNSAYRYEVVASVDGLDVIDGQPASFTKRGYIVEPWSTITVDGWRTSTDSIAAFRFSGMDDSYAERTGQGRNIGVIGFAFFHERGGVPWQELHRRDSADPFPRRFAEPPPPRTWR